MWLVRKDANGEERTGRTVEQKGGGEVSFCPMPAHTGMFRGEMCLLLYKRERALARN